MNNAEFDKLIAFNVAEKLNYISNTIVVKDILNEHSGTIQAMAFDFGKVLTCPPNPFDTFIQIIEGKAEIVIDDISTYLLSGDSIIIPGHTANTIEANQRFKMLSIVLKSGYESTDS